MIVNYTKANELYISDNSELAKLIEKCEKTSVYIIKNSYSSKSQWADNVPYTFEFPDKSIATITYKFSGKFNSFVFIYRFSYTLVVFSVKGDIIDYENQSLFDYI